MSDNILAAGLESIDIQTDEFFAQVTEWVGRARQYFTEDKTKPNKIIENALTKEISGMIKKRFNLSVVFLVLANKYDSTTIFSCTDAINPNSGLFANTFGKAQLESSVQGFKKHYEDTLKKTPGWMDKKRAKVHGVFSEITFHIGATTGVLTNKDVPDDCIAAMILHEIGHIWDTLAMLSVEYGLVQGMTDLHRTLAGLDSPEDKKYVITYVNDREKLELTEEIINQTANSVTAGADVACNLILASRVSKLRSQTGSLFYEKKTAEQGADVFAARFGAEKALVQMLDIFGKPFLDHRNKSAATSALIISIKLLVNIVTVPLYVVGTLATLAAHETSTYDNRFDRIEKMKHQLVIRTKDQTLSNDMVMSIMDDIRVIDDILLKYTNRPDLSSYIKIVFSGNFRKSIQQQNLVYHLERMANNKLFAAAAVVKSLA